MSEKLTARNEYMALLKSQGRTLEYIGKSFGITRERVRQLVGDVEVVEKFDPKPKKELQICRTIKERLDKYTIKQEGCWGWSGGVSNGYGNVRGPGGNIYAHRARWEECYGEIPDGMCVLHNCDNPLCTNPDHLRLGTPVENMQDRKDRNRLHGSTLTFELATEIRGYFNNGLATPYELSRIFKVTPATIYRVLSNKEYTLDKLVQNS